MQCCRAIKLTACSVLHDLHNRWACEALTQHVYASMTWKHCNSLDASISVEKLSAHHLAHLVALWPAILRQPLGGPSSAIAACRLRGVFRPPYIGAGWACNSQRISNRGRLRPTAISMCGHTKQYLTFVKLPSNTKLLQKQFSENDHQLFRNFEGTLHTQNLQERMTFLNHYTWSSQFLQNQQTLPSRPWPWWAAFHP